MAQDCEQALGYMGKVCRYLDSNGLCYTYKMAQDWCSKNPSDAVCRDGGASWAPAPFGTAPLVDDSGFVPMQDAVVAGASGGAKYSCACLKHCSCTGKSDGKHACRCAAGDAAKPVGDANELALVATKTKDSGKQGKCFCSCGGQTSG
mmetsp:Transcript_26679/g.70036  ORF Transcript_26679/g.70036 Transcript_26679/m.70036 type:complete len:148 (-) Transcript_26679:7-450(-)